VPALTPQNDEVRAQNVSASEVGALMGQHPYATDAGIYDRLRGAGADRESEAMNLGSFMEASILRFAEQRDGFRARLNRRTFAHRDVRLCATPDAFIVKPQPGLFVPERALVEIKMSGRSDLWRDLPDHVAWQARAQMACTGRDVVYVYTLVGMSLRTFAVYRDLVPEAEMLDRVQRFWTDHVVARVRPEPAAPVQPMTFSFEADPSREQEAIA
jgi:predicted phage-related endonuclease